MKVNSKPSQALVINLKDNVATATRDIPLGTAIEITRGEKREKLKVRQRIPMGHKIALKDIPAGGSVIKYGEVIGRAKKKIKRGELVHVDNMEGIRGKGG